MSNPFGVPDGDQGISSLVDQSVILNTALVPKLPEIAITDGMIPIIDQIYSDSGSNSTFVPGTTLNFNFGNSTGKLVDWTQSRLVYDVNFQIEVNQTPSKDATVSAPQDQPLMLQDYGVYLALRHGAMVFSQVTFGGAGRPITINDFEMVALSQSLLRTCESNVDSHVGDISTHSTIRCGSTLPNFKPSTGQLFKGNYSGTIHVSVPLSSVMPMFGGVDNYLLSTTSGIELRLTVTTNNGIFSYVQPNWQLVWNSTKKGWIWKTEEKEAMGDLPFLNRFIENPTPDIIPFPEKNPNTAIWTLNTKLVNLSNVHIDMISTQHPDDTILQMINTISIQRGLFYPNQMCIATPFNIHISKNVTHHQLLIPVCAGYRNIDSVFCWWTKRGNYTKLVKMPMINVYTSLNGVFKTPVHGFRDHVYYPMVETAQQFNRCFGTVNSTLLSPMSDIMESYMPAYSNFLTPTADADGKRQDPSAETIQHAIEGEWAASDSFICNSTMWELEKSSWMNGPDFSQHANKYQIVFDLEHVTDSMEGDYTFWVIHRFDSYTHVYGGYINILTTKEEVAMALAQAQQGQAITA